MSITLNRRAALLGLAGAVTFGRAALAVAPANTDRRFVVVILRGALDGMAAVQPYGDPALKELRAGLALPDPGADGGLLDLGGFFGLHPALAGVHAMAQDNQALIVHAVAGPDRSRSHFEAQDALEMGADHRITSGWLNRVAAALPPAPGTDVALAVGTGVPLVLRGPKPVANWAPQSFGTPDASLYARILAANAADPVTGPAITEALKERGFSREVLSGMAQPPNKYAFSALAEAAGRVLAAPDGPRLAAMELGGWDTHVGQKQRLPAVLRELDGGLVALKSGLGDAWPHTAVLVVTEFGRTARENGTNGTDHGTGTVAFLVGGAVAGGRVRGDWPGLGSGKLFENRDLQPTTELRGLAKGVLARHLGLDEPALARVFPDSNRVAAVGGLIAA